MSRPDWVQVRLLLWVGSWVGGWIDGWEGGKSSKSIVLHSKTKIYHFGWMLFLMEGWMGGWMEAGVVGSRPGKSDAYCRDSGNIFLFPFPFLV